MSLSRESSGGVAKCLLFLQAITSQSCCLHHDLSGTGYYSGILVQKKIIHSLSLFIFQAQELKSNWLTFNQLLPVTHHFPHGVWFLNSDKDRLVVNLTEGTYHFQGKTENSGWKIKWFALFHLGSFRKYGPWFEGSKFFCSFQSVQLIWIWYFLMGHSPSVSNFIVLCLGTRFPPGWFVYMVSTQGPISRKSW